MKHETAQSEWSYSSFDWITWSLTRFVRSFFPFAHFIFSSSPIKTNTALYVNLKLRLFEKLMNHEKTVNWGEAWIERKVFNWITYRVMFEMCFRVITSFGRKQTEVITVVTVNAMCNYRGIGFLSKYIFCRDCRVNFRGDEKKKKKPRVVDWSTSWHWTRIWI